MTRDPYEVLGVRTRRERRDQAGLSPPCQAVPPGPPSRRRCGAKKMNEINEAYDLLKNPQAYQAYRQQQQQNAYQQAYRQQQSAYQQQNQQYYDPFGFWTSQTGSQDGQDPNQHYYRLHLSARQPLGMSRTRSTSGLIAARAAAEFSARLSARTFFFAAARLALHQLRLQRVSVLLLRLFQPARLRLLRDL